jgi:pyridoxamine 5'-phosphate oxidase
MAINYGDNQPGLPPLLEEDVDADPIRQFRRWYDQALASGVTLPEAMTLATATPDGKPSARMVLVRGIDERGFIFYTNYGSRKGRELAANPWASLVLFWEPLERQVRVEGRVERVAEDLSDAYFRTRPRDSQLGAWASTQSEVIAGRHVLESRVQALRKQFGEGEIPRPPAWGGLRVLPEVVEFWQGRAGRLHDRIRYRKAGPTAWLRERLAP